MDETKKKKKKKKKNKDDGGGSAVRGKEGKGVKGASWKRI